MRLVLGVDGGGTGCRAALADARGRVLGRGQAGPANIVTDPDGARANILAAAAEALGTRAAPGEVHAVLGLAGANLPGYGARLASALPFATARIESDVVIALKGALGGADGVLATIGTGSVFAVQRQGAVRTVGGWGLVLGDEASGAWLGRALLAAALHAGDGLRPMTPLLRAVLTEGGGAAALVDFARTAAPVALAAQAPRLLQAADDPAAAEILARADDWIARSIDLLRDGSDVPVTFLGGLGAAFAERLAPRYGRALRPPLGTALDGALWLARQEPGT
ncbi:MAG: ATPase [Paracoccaceae bacterium]|nr:ATPase [Paracoccaceae bacterium]